MAKPRIRTLYNISIFLLTLVATPLMSQEVDIVQYNIDVNGSAHLTVESDNGKYYILQVRNTVDSDWGQEMDLQLGTDGPLVLSESIKGYPIDHYRVVAYDIDTPQDMDRDSIDDITEYQQLGALFPFNAAKEVAYENGVISIVDRATFKDLSYKGEEGLFNENLWNVEFVKFYIFDADTDRPRLWYINSETHRLHSGFANAEGLGGWQGSGHLPGRIKGHIIYHPDVLSANGTLGTFRFGFSDNGDYLFPEVQMVHDLIGATMPFLKNNLCYYPLGEMVEIYHEEKEMYDASRICVLEEEDIFADVPYQAMHLAEGYGLLRELNSGDYPSSRDIVLLGALPNELSRVGGIISSVRQTPLSHVNLRAIQDDVPNAYVQDATIHERIAPLIGKYIYFRTDQASFEIREATLEEVNTWYDDIRPDESQIPMLNLSYQEFLPLDEIDFDMSDGFGAKTCNVATLRTFGFPEGTIPDGYALPFYYYQEFMKYNGLFSQAESMIADPQFVNDLAYRIEKLTDFRKTIRDAELPQWMYDAFTDLQENFPEGTSIRCRSSTNNEDLPGFIGAGLYDSKTQHPDEGHISKSIQQVYASMWNLRAFDERDFYRVDHFIASMGILCHPNYSDELANGVGVTTDPIYQTDGTFYLNNQIGEDLITNPEAQSTPEEILLDEIPVTEDDYEVIRYSNISDGQLILREDQLDLLRQYLITIHDEFAQLYETEDHPNFAMEIEYKITADDQLSIKQARPWAGYWTLDTGTTDLVNGTNKSPVKVYPNPLHEVAVVELCVQQDEIVNLSIYDINGRQVWERNEVQIRQGINHVQLNLRTARMDAGIYFLAIHDRNSGKISTSTRFVKCGSR